MKKANKTTEQKKIAVHKRAEQLDSNNNKNLLDNPIKKQSNELVRDDGFEHRTSEETTDKV